MMAKTYIPNGPCLVVLVGPSGGGKSTFTQKYFEEREVVTSDGLRDWLTGDFQRQDKNQEVFDEFHRRIEVRLKAGQRAVADATHLRDGDRKRTAEIGFMMNVPVYYVVINRSVVGKMQTGGWRNEVRMGNGVTLIESHEETFRANESKILAGDGFKWVRVIDTRDEHLDLVVAKSLPRDPVLGLRFLYQRGFRKIRIIPDIHGNLPGLKSVLSTVDAQTFCLFLGDIVDYGTESWPVVDIVEQMVSSGLAIMVRGNHDRKIARYVQQTIHGGEFTGQIGIGNDVTINQLKAMNRADALRYQTQFLGLMEQTPDWIELGDWLFAHAAVDAKMYGNPLFRAHRNSYLETMAIYGEADPVAKTEKGYPVRTYGWIERMPARKNAVLGHQILSVVAPVERRTSTGGRVVFMDTGSAKDLDDVPGFLSYWDMDIVNDSSGRRQDGVFPKLRLEPHDTFGRE
jgi:protein phosphatase